jgi:hypothetical protein
MLIVELGGQFIKPPKLRGEEKLALSTIHLIARLYVMRNTRDSENMSTNGYICSSKVRSADIRGRVRSKNP